MLRKTKTPRAAMRAFMLRHIRPGSTVLDIGCGGGTLALRVSRRVPSATVDAVDVDPLSLRRARRTFRRMSSGALRCHHADVTALRRLFGRQRFEAAMTMNAFHEFWNPVRALREIRAVLKPDGALLLAELTPRVGETVDDCPRYSREKIVELVRRGGFRTVSVTLRHGAILIRAEKG